MDIKQHYKWSELNNSKSGIIKTILANWEELLDKNLHESVYHSFLAEYAGFFLSDLFANIIISKLKISTSFETDFVVVHDGFSGGNVYELIEIEKPSSKLFNSKGIPSADFNTALQQVRDWKNTLLVKRKRLPTFLPTFSQYGIHPNNFKFTIIIGRRDSLTEKDLERRADIEYETGIKIKTFDRLTDELKRRRFFNDFEPHDNVHYCPHIDYNHILNPFNRAFSDSDWKKICAENKISRSDIYTRDSSILCKYAKQAEIFKEFSDTNRHFIL